MVHATPNHRLLRRKEKKKPAVSWALEMCLLLELIVLLLESRVGDFVHYISGNSGYETGI